MSDMTQRSKKSQNLTRAVHFLRLLVTMIDAKAVTAFLCKCVGNLWIFSLVLFTLEQLMDDEFICPCERIYNILTCILYAVVPSFGCFVFTFWFADLSSNTEDGGGQKDCRCRRVIYSILTTLVWLCLFFLDGRYLACGLTYWTGVDAKHDTMGDLNWCKPTGGINMLPSVECREKTVKWMSMSHFLGLLLVLLISVTGALSYCCTRLRPHRRCDSCRDQHEGVTLKTQSKAEEQEAGV
ncbi:uncharacterized protein Hap1MRO34_026151 [Clarias gariepinus]